MAKKTTTTADFDSQIKELELLVAQMEKGDLSLEASLAQFERGIALLRQCETQLQAAEQRVQVLMQTREGEVLVDFESGDTV